MGTQLPIRGSSGSDVIYFESSTRESDPTVFGSRGTCAGIQDDDPILILVLEYSHSRHGFEATLRIEIDLILPRT